MGIYRKPEDDPRYYPKNPRSIRIQQYPGGGLNAGDGSGGGGSAGGVTSFEGRTGVVVSELGDYDETEITTDPTGLSHTDGTTLDEVIADFDAAITAASGGSGPPTGNAGGVLDGTYPNPGLAASVAGAGLTETTNVLSVNVDDVTIEIATDTLRVKNDGISNAKLANMGETRIKGRVSSGTGDPEDLTGTQVNTFLPEFTGDSGLGGVKGLVPAPTGGDAEDNKFLNADGSWAVVDAIGIAQLDDEAIRSGVNIVVSDIIVGRKVRCRVPFDCTITRASILADASGSLVLDIWKDTHTNAPPTVDDSITASAKPTISSGIKYEDDTLTGWTTAISTGDWLIVNVDSVTSITEATLSLELDRT